MIEVESQEQLGNELEKAGLVSTAYRRGPVGKEIFVLNLDNKNVLKYWKGLANVQVGTDKRRKQAVIVENEPRRSITRSYSIYSGFNSADKERLDQRAKLGYPVEGRGRKITKIEYPDGTFDEHGYARSSLVTVKVTATFTESTNSFLVGFDEQAQFISMLPETPRSVEHAHEILRPKGVPKDALRQGEWFFVPLKRDERRVVDRIVRDSPGRIKRRTLVKPSQYYRGETHEATQTILLHESSPRYYVVSGYVFDRRKGRHGTLHLDDWYKLVRNNEVEQGPLNTGTRYWD